MSRLKEGPGKRDDYITPDWLLCWVIRNIAPIDLDPCANAADRHIDFISRSYLLAAGQDGLELQWHGHTFVNPPYGPPIEQWVQKAVREVANNGADLVTMLLPARTDTRWWSHCYGAQEWIFLTGRVRFILPETLAPEPSPQFPSVLVVFRRGLRHGPVVSMLDVKKESKR